MLRGMIGLLKGKVEDKGTDSVLIDVQGVGYEVSVPLSTLAGLPKKGDPVTLYIHTHVREDDLKLFGFESQNNKLAFQTMLKVSGVGPKLALAVLGALSGAELARVIGEGNAKRLSSIPGIGKKTAERMILELGGKLKTDAGKGGGVSAGMLSELSSALQNLGFKGGQVDRVVAEIRAKGLQEAPFEVMLREALGLLKER
jgi:Holliday junction DNA helicase RuvA